MFHLRVIFITDTYLIFAKKKKKKYKELHDLKANSLGVLELHYFIVITHI